MIFFYRALVVLALAIGSPFLIIKALVGKHGIRERLGFVRERESSARLFWFHAASVGELKVVSTVVKEIEKTGDKIEFAISSTTVTGKKRAQEIFGERAFVFLQPLELKSAVRRVLRRLRPDKLVVVETELWPLLLSESDAAGAEIYLVNARMRERSYRAYRLIRPLVSSSLKRFDDILAQTEADAARFRGLGAEQVRVVGNLKYDQMETDGTEAASQFCYQGDAGFVFVAGSIRRGEHEMMADLITRSVQGGIDAGFVIVPRHLKDTGLICDHFSSRGIKFRRRSEFAGCQIKPEAVLIVDSMGELQEFYKLANLAFVGGSLVPVGGHDPVEPASLGKAVVFGPYMNNSKEAAELLLESGAARQVEDVTELLGTLKEAVGNRRMVDDMGNRGRSAVNSMRGASRKTALILLGNST